MYSGNTQFGAQPQSGYSGMAGQPPMGQPPMGQQPMGQQPVTYNSVPVASNQVVAINQQLDPNQFKLSPIVVKCPYCFQTTTTTVETSCSCCACCVCFMTGFVLYLCIQSCRGKEYCCQDAVHRCPNCGKDIGFYKAI